MRWTRHVTRIGKMRYLYQILVGKPERKRPHGRLRHRWEDSITMYLREIGREVVDWIHLTQNRVQWRTLVNTVMNIQVP
jgi:hypothetical protein